GKIVVAGTFTAADGSTDIAVARFTPLGTLDTSFGAGGRQTIDIKSGSNDQGRAVAIQPDGKIVVAGLTIVGPGDSDFAVARLNADGSLDTSFNSTGIQTVAFNIGPAASGSTPAARDDEANGVAIQSDGKIVLAGFAQVNATGNNDFAVARLNS